jgi:hypothetical protein
LLLFPQAHTTYPRISQAVQNTLSTVQFSELTTGLRNQQITKEIISSLIAVHGEDNHFLESLVTQLREQCPNFFTDTDELLFGAHRLFTIATKMPTLKERKEALTASADHFLRVAPALTVDILDGIKEKYLGIGFYSGVVKLTLRHFTVHSKDPDFNPERYAKIITDVFDQLQKVSDENSDPTQTLELNEAKLEVSTSSSSIVSFLPFLPSLFTGTFFTFTPSHSPFFPF